MEPCNHPFHLECWRDYFETCLKDRQIPIVCIYKAVTKDPCNSKIIPEVHIKQILGQEAMETYDEALFKKSLNNEKLSVKCPNPIC